MTYGKFDEITTKIEGDFIAMLDEWHSLPETWDNELDAQIHRWYADPPKVWPKRPYFSPSSTNSCPRELYVKAKGGKRDEEPRQPHQGRWTRIGTSIGDIIQRDLIFIEKHFEAKTGNTSPFRLLRTKSGAPAFEDFAKHNKEVRIGDETFYLYGAPDGLLEYTTDEGENVRVGLEIKSKQTTNARTSLYSMQMAEESHVKQCVAYAHMYDVDYYIILYVNASKKSWVMSNEEYEKTPDIRAFCYHFDTNDKYALMLELADVQQAIGNSEPPKLDVDKWTFNNFKTASAKTLTDEELVDIEAYVERVKASSLPTWKKRQAAATLADIKRRRLF